MFKKDIEFLKNDEYFIDKVLNRPSKNLSFNQIEQQAFLKAFSPFIGSASGVINTADEQNFNIVDVKSVTLTSPYETNPRTFIFSQLPCGFLIHNNRIYSNYVNTYEIERYLEPLLDLNEVDTERLSIRFVNNKFKAKITKQYLPDTVLQNTKTVYFISAVMTGVGYNTQFENDTDGFDNFIDLVIAINNYDDNDIDLRGLLYNLDFSILPGYKGFIIPINSTYVIGFNNNFIIEPLATTTIPINLRFATINTNTPITVTDTRIFVKTHIVEDQDNTEITSTVASTSPTTGALVVTGGSGIGGSLNVGDSINITTGPLTLPGTTENTGIIFSNDIKFYRANPNTLRTNSSLIVDKDLTVTGFTTFVGGTATQGPAVTTTSFLVLNDQGTNPVTLESGIEIKRNTDPSYRFYFRESDDCFVSGVVGGSQQAIAHRENVPTSYAIPFWNSTTKQFETSATFTLQSGTLSITDNISLGATNKTLNIISPINTDIPISNVAERKINLGGISGSATARKLTITNALGAANLQVKTGIGVGIEPQESIHTTGAIRIDEGGNAGFKILYDNVSKALQFIFVGS